MDRPTLADDFLLAVTVAIADVPIRLAQDYSQCDAGPATLGSRAIFFNCNPPSRELGLPGSRPLPEPLPLFALKSQLLPRDIPR